MGIAYRLAAGFRDPTGAIGGINHGIHAISVIVLFDIRSSCGWRHPTVPLGRLGEGHAEAGAERPADRLHMEVGAVNSPAGCGDGKGGVRMGKNEWCHYGELFRWRRRMNMPTFATDCPYPRPPKSSASVNRLSVIFIGNASWRGTRSAARCLFSPTAWWLTRPNIAIGRR